MQTPDAPRDERTALIAEIARTLDAYNRRRPWASIVIWQADTARAFAGMARAIVNDPGIKRAMTMMRDLNARYPALFAIPATTRHGAYRRRPVRSRYVRRIAP